MKNISHNSHIQLLQSWHTVGTGMPPGFTGGYSYWALSELFVIIPDVHIICMKTAEVWRNEGSPSLSRNLYKKDVYKD